MITEEIRNIKIRQKGLRSFGFSLGIVFVVWGLSALRHSIGWYYYFFILSAIFMLSALLSPALLKPLYKIFSIIFIIMAWIISSLILVILFYFIVTPISIVLRLSGKNPLDINFDKKRESYWVPGKDYKFDKSAYEKQF